MATFFEHQQPLNDFGFCRSAPMEQHGGVYGRLRRPSRRRADAPEEAIASKPAVMVAAGPARPVLKPKPLPRASNGSRRVAAPLDRHPA